MGLFDLFKGETPDERAQRAAGEGRQAEILDALRRGAMPRGIERRLEGAR